MDQTKFFEFLWKDKRLQSENKSLLRVNESEFTEFSSSEIILEEQVFYKNRFQYIDLVRNCLDGKINCYALQWDFFEMYYKDMNRFDKLITKIGQSGIDGEMNFQNDSKIKNFSSLLGDELVPMCEFVGNGLSEEQFYHELKQVYSKMLKYSEPTPGIENKSEILFLTVGALLTYLVLNPTTVNLLWQSTNIIKL